MDHQQANVLPDIRQTALINAPIAKAWKAIATAEGIAAWFMPNDFEPVVGHKFHLDAGPYGMSPCEVLAVEPPTRVTFRWSADWVITFELRAQGDQTEFTLIHAGWDADKVTEFGEPMRVVRDRMGNGWVGLVRKLAAHLEG